MSLSSILPLTSLTTSNLTGVSRSSGGACAASDSSSDGQQANGISRFTTAIQNAFASLGISLDASSDTSASTTSSSASSSTTDTTSAASTDTTDAVGSFLQSLFAALHNQSAGSAPPPPPSDDASTADSDATTRTASVGHGHHHHGGKLEGDLQSLISELTSSSTSTTDSSSTTTGTTTDAPTGTTTATATATSSDTTLSTLEKNFDALLAQNGVATASGNDTLTAFLQSLASSLHGAPATGNVVSTAA